MKYQIVFLISFVCVLLAGEAESKPTEQVCEPESIVMRDCNQCKCNKSGTDMLCTRKICTGSLDGIEVPQEEREKRDVQDDEACRPGEIFKHDCNSCRCPPSGRKAEGICTLVGCLSGDFNIFKQNV